MNDGRNKFFRFLDLDKNDKKLLKNYIEIKNNMLRDKVEDYFNGRITKEE
jgi:hypothetical protein